MRIDWEFHNAILAATGFGYTVPGNLLMVLFGASPLLPAFPECMPKRLRDFLDDVEVPLKTIRNICLCGAGHSKYYPFEPSPRTREDLDRLPQTLVEQARDLLQPSGMDTRPYIYAMAEALNQICIAADCDPGQFNFGELTTTHNTHQLPTPRITQEVKLLPPSSLSDSHGLVQVLEPERGGSRPRYI